MVTIKQGLHPDVLIKQGVTSLSSESFTLLNAKVISSLAATAALHFTWNTTRESTTPFPTVILAQRIRM